MRAAGRSSVIIRSGFLESRYTRRFERQITSTAHKKRHTRRLGYQRRKGGFQLGLRTLPLPILTGEEIPELQAAGTTTQVSFLGELTEKFRSGVPETRFAGHT